MMVLAALLRTPTGRLAVLSALAVFFSAPQAGARRQDPPAQDPPPQRPVFRVGTDVVRVDVYPRRGGRIVEGLERDDFQVFEDGQPQTIETFEYVRFEWDAETSPLEPRDAREALRMAADPQNRVFVFFLDTYHVTWEGALRARDPILQFLREGLGPRDLFGVLTPQQSPELLTLGRATNEAAMAMSLGRTWGLLDTPVQDPNEMAISSCGGGLLTLWRIDRTFSGLEGLMVRLSAVRQERKNIVLISDRWPNVMMLNRPPAPAPLEPAAPAAMPGAGTIAFQGGRGSFPGPTGLFSGGVCAAEGRRLRGIDFRRRMQELPELSRAANVAVYVMMPGVRNLFNDPSGQFRGLALDTDGISLVTNDLYNGLERITDHQTGYYMLGYRSTSGPTDRRARKIEVKTTRRGVDLEARREYYPPTPEDLAGLDRTATERTDVMRALDQLERIRETTNLFVRVAPRGTAVEVTAEVALSAMARGRWRQGADVEVIVRDASGAERARASGRIADGARGARLRVPVPAGEPAARVAVRVTGPGGDLAEFVDVPSSLGGLFGAPLVSRAGSLPSMPFQPAAELQFERTDRVRVEWPAAALDERAVRVVNAAGEERPVTIEVTDVDDEGENGRLVRADLRVLGLAPADYVLEITGRSGEETGRHLLAFRVLR